MDYLKPTEKNKEIDNLLTNLVGISRQDAFKQQVCTWCKKPIIPFRDQLSEKEYQISGLCQKCQDDTFGE